MDCPTVHAGKRFKALTDSGAAVSLVHISVNNMTKDHNKTKILPAAVHLKAADGSAMSLLGKDTLHLHTANFKFFHTFIMCDKLPDTGILLGIDKKDTLYHIVGMQTNNYSYRGKDHFWLTIETVNSNIILQ